MTTKNKQGALRAARPRGLTPIEARTIADTRQGHILDALSKLEEAAEPLSENAQAYARTNRRRRLAEAALEYAGVVRNLLEPSEQQP